MNSNTSTINQWILSTDTKAEESVTVSALAEPSAPAKKEETENAIYAYLQAVRALGHKTVSTVQIADALAIPVAVVDQALAGLRKKGVKPLGA